mmetsp:Transcript_26047/g.65762  ORF Transcript_26047/g.65762 Transcript_26047/m.65762 type:complete len:120 (-) Transcript_26047:210-569(-)
MFEGKSGTEAFECVEMREGKPWKEQVDLYAVAATVHVLLHSEYMETVSEGGSWKPKAALKRYWQTETWTAFFDACINGGGCISAAKRPLEAYFAANPAKAAAVRMALVKQDIMVDAAGR